MLDTSVLISAERGHLALKDVEARNEPLFVSPIAISELLVGVERADESRREPRRQFIEGLIGRFEVSPITVATARIHASLTAMLMRAGTPIGIHDLWMAASCIERDLVMMTSNEQEFRRVPGLTVEVWR